MKIQAILRGAAKGIGLFDNTFKYRVFMVAVPSLFGYELLSATSYLSGMQWLVVGLFGVCSTILSLIIIFVILTDVVRGAMTIESKACDNN